MSKVIKKITEKKAYVDMSRQERVTGKPTDEDAEAVLDPESREYSAKVAAETKGT